LGISLIQGTSSLLQSNLIFNQRACILLPQSMTLPKHLIHSQRIQHKWRRSNQVPHTFCL
jgi:hypothetical protein